VFIGIGSNDYGVMLNASAGPARDLYAGTGSALSIAAGRLCTVSA
jgi:acyl transferase domain-containing protein